MSFTISEETITAAGLYILLPIFIAFLFFIMWDMAKSTNAGRAGTFWIFVALGAGFVGFLLKIIIEWVLGTWFI
ncbi:MULTISPECIES: DUF2788 domain-containing protein [unclassified Moraxella]|uniref:DUF2788 domain-containing protein n=1 Tax=unclassified Moraxella TaxID=2685852 RepID=UPI002B413517|nr:MULTISPECIES: DUF2788 domain-containing protein [unclassified Moraxella]